MTVQDTTAPELTIPADYTTECSEAIVYDDASASDNCSPVVLEEVSRKSGRRLRGHLPDGSRITATDDAGNSTTLVQTISVQDTTAPELTIPEDYVVECSDELILDDALAVDNCSFARLNLISARRQQITASAWSWLPNSTVNWQAWKPTVSTLTWPHLQMC